MAASTTNIAAGTIVVVIAGQWTKGKVLPIEVIVGGTVYILILSGINEASPKLARNFALLVLISALFFYAVPVFQGLGLLDKPKREKKRDRR